MVRSPWEDPETGLLSTRFPLPLDGPFDRVAARAGGITDRQLGILVRRGLLRRVLQGVYAASQAPDSVEQRLRALTLVLPADTVVTDRTAGWLHGMPVLKRGSHLEVVPVDVATVTDTRVRRRGTDGHRRQLLRRDVTELHGVPVTTPLRTASDLGRLLWRYDALAALDAALRIGVSHLALSDEVARFKGYRGVRQLRALVPLADRRSESRGESALRLHWYEAGLPTPEPQYWILDDGGRERYRLDLAAPTVRYAAEYDGEEFHSLDDDVEHDRTRRAWIEGERRWRIDVFGKDDVYGPSARIHQCLWNGFCRARSAAAVWRP